MTGLEPLDSMDQAMNQLFEKVQLAPVELSPFPHIYIKDVFPMELFAQLSAAFPSLDFIRGAKPVENNKLYLRSFGASANAPELKPVWTSFMSEYFDESFFKSVIEKFCNTVPGFKMGLESALGRPFSEMSVTSREKKIESDIVFDCQFGVNSPVTSVSRVRAIHVDKPVKIFNALLYMRLPEDKTPGGDLGIYKFKNEPVYYKTTEVHDEYADQVEVIPYQANSLILFLNSPLSLHGVTPRHVTSLPRRYVNFLAEAKVPLFDLSRHQEK